MKFSPEKLKKPLSHTLVHSFHFPSNHHKLELQAVNTGGGGGGSPRGQSVAFPAPHFMIVKHSVSHNL